MPHCSLTKNFPSGKEPTSLTLTRRETAYNNPTPEKNNGPNYIAPNKGKILLNNEQKLKNYPNKNNKVQV